MARTPAGRRSDVEPGGTIRSTSRPELPAPHSFQERIKEKGHAPGTDRPTLTDLATGYLVRTGMSVVPEL